MKRKQWMVGIAGLFICVAAAFVQPTEVKAATQSELKAYRAVFDASYYYNAYPDVAEAIGMDDEALFNHFVNYGVKEGRNASEDFNVQAYRQRYTDLQQAFGSNLASYCSHYVNYGRSEGRNAGADGLVVTVTTSEAVSQQTTAADKANIEKIEKKAPETGERVQQSASGNVIGTCTTSYTANNNRAVNVELAAQRVNGVVVQPGASFSFSRTILARTPENGYLPAPIYIGGRVGTGTGGGVCQVSSTLYAAMVYAGLPATERHAHSLPVDYLPKGLDATIAGNYKDLKFTNVYSQPLLIQASAQGGTLTVSLVLQ